MRKLTFAGFTKQYVAELSLRGTTAVYPLVREAASENPRLQEPLFLYAYANHKLEALLKASKNAPFHETYRILAKLSEQKRLQTMLESGSPLLPEEYHKVWASYLSVAGMPERNARVKILIGAKVRRLQSEKGVSTYRICRDLGLNNANINAWLKNQNPNKVGLKTARAILTYMENSAAKTFPEIKN